MLRQSDSVGTKTAHKQRSETQMADNVVKKPRIEEFSNSEKSLDAMKSLYMNNMTAKNTKIKEQKEQISMLQITNNKQKTELNRLNSHVKTLECQLENEKIQRQGVTNKVTETKKMCNQLQKYSDHVSNILQKCEEGRHQISSLYMAAIHEVEQAKADRQKDEEKYESNLNEIKKQLEREKQLRIDFLNVENEKTVKTNEYIDHLKNQITSLEETMKKLQLSNEEFANRDKQQQQNISNLYGTIKQKEQAMQSEFTLIYNKLAQEKKDMSESLDEKKTRICQLEDELEESKVILKNQDARFKDFQEEVLDLNEKIEMLTKEVEEQKSTYEGKLTDLQMMKDAFENQNFTLTNIKIELEEEISCLKQKFEENKSLIQEKCNEKYDLEKELEILRDEKENEKTLLGMEFDTKLKDIIKSHEEEIKIYETKNVELRNDLEVKSSKIIELISLEESANRKLKERESDLDNMTYKIKLLNEETKILNEYYNTQIDELKGKLADTENMYDSVTKELEETKQKLTNKNVVKQYQNMYDVIFNRRTGSNDSAQEKDTTAKSSNVVEKQIQIVNDNVSDEGTSALPKVVEAPPKIVKKHKRREQKEIVSSTNEAISKARGKSSNTKKKSINIIDIFGK